MAETAEAKGKSKVPKRRAGRPATARSKAKVMATLPVAGVKPPSGYKSSPDCELINSLARGLQVLAAFGPDDDLLANKDIAARTSIPKPSISRLTDTLVKLSYLEQDVDSGLYRLGRAAVSLGLTARKTIDLPSIARPYIEQFALQHEVLVTLGALVGHEVRARAVFGSPGSGIQVALGGRFPLDETALGLGYLAGLESHQRTVLLSALGSDLGSAWPESSARIETALRQFEQQGFCTSLGEWGGTRNAIGAPLGSGVDGTALSISCGAEKERMPASSLNELAPYFMGLVGTIRTAARLQLQMISDPGRKVQRSRQ